MKKVRLSILFSFLVFGLLAQENARLDLVYLTGGSFLRGRLIDSIPGKIKTIRLLSGAEISIPVETIQKIKKTKTSRMVLPSGRTIPSKGRYFAAHVQTLSARNSSEFDDSNRWDWGAHFSGGYQFNQWVNLGLGLGVDFYEKAFAPIFVENRGYFQNRGISPFYSVQVGYALPLGEWLDGADDFDESVKFKGGFLFYPSLGLRLATRLDASFLIDVGYKFQHYSRIFNFSNTKDKILLKSFSARIGLLF